MDAFTIGYGGRNKESFLALLRAHGIRTVVDVRLRPDRASMGIWVKAKTPDKGIEGWLHEAGFEYRSLVELGNVFSGLADWRQRYADLLDQAGALLTERLMTTPGPICLMCAEKDFHDCHRQQIAEYVTRHQSIAFHHLV